MHALKKKKRVNQTNKPTNKQSKHQKPQNKQTTHKTKQKYTKAFLAVAQKSGTSPETIIKCSSLSL